MDERIDTLDRDRHEARAATRADNAEVARRMDERIDTLDRDRHEARQREGEAELRAIARAEEAERRTEANAQAREAANYQLLHTQVLNMGRGVDPEPPRTLATFAAAEGAAQQPEAPPPPGDNA